MTEHSSIANILRQTMSGLAGSLLQGDVSGSSSSIGAVQRALSETGASSLRELVAREMPSALPRLPFPAWTSDADAANAHPTITQSSATSAASITTSRMSSQLPPPPRPMKAKFDLVDASELPSWFTPYPYIETGYRVDFSYSLGLGSLFRLHNETVNVYTEFLPAIGFGCWTAAFLEEHSDSPLPDRYIVGVGLIVATVVRPLCSGFAHLLHCTGARGYIFWWSVDYLSICLAILASSVVSGHFAFYCTPSLQMLFFTSAAGLLSTTIVAVMAVASPGLRATSFLLFVLFSNGVPFLYQLGTKVFAQQQAYPANVDARYLQLWAASLATFALGLVVKSSSLPERVALSRWPDFYLSSHNLWHVILNFGFVLGTFLSWGVYLDWRGKPENQCPHA